MNQVVRTEALREAVTILGSQKEVADLVGCTQPAISLILKERRDVPAEWCPKIEAATAEKGKPISRQQLRPDLWQAEVGLQ